MDDEMIKARRADYAALTAERDRLAAENAELLALVDRVKAESLRVVDIQIGVARSVYDWYMTPSGLGYQGLDSDGNRYVETPDGNYEYSDCKPVRLERWGTTGVRDIAAAHGFDPMPADLAQRSVDGETNYVRLNPESKP